MKNTLTDLNNHLFAQIERLSEEGLNGDQLNIELERTKGISAIANQIVNNGRLALEAQKALGAGKAEEVPKWLEIKK
jgi:hypothetical protein